MMMLLLLMWGVVLMWRFWSQGFAIIFDCCCYWRGASWCVLFGDGDALLRGGKMIFFACVAPSVRGKNAFFLFGCENDLFRCRSGINEKRLLSDTNISPPSIFQLRCQLQLRFNAVRQQSKVYQQLSTVTITYTNPHIHSPATSEQNEFSTTTTATAVHNTVLTKHKQQHTIIFIIYFRSKQHE